MNGPAASAIAVLASHCNVEAVSVSNGWAVDRWRLDDDARRTLIDAYRASRLPNIANDVVERLEELGLDLERLFSDPDEVDSPNLVRADMVEIAAAAALVAQEGAPVALLQMPNVPKPSRRWSAPGIDVLAPLIDSSRSGTELLPGEGLVVCSAKHTVTDSGRLRRELVSSLTDKLELPELAMQVRVLVENLHARAIDATRLYMSLTRFPGVGVLWLVGLGASAPDLGLELQIKNLPVVDADQYTFRMLIIDGLPTLHEEWR